MVECLAYLWTWEGQVTKRNTAGVVLSPCVRFPACRMAKWILDHLMGLRRRACAQSARRCSAW